jgi:hypothetical protein
MLAYAKLFMKQFEEKYMLLFVVVVFLGNPENFVQGNQKKNSVVSEFNDF